MQGNIRAIRDVMERVEKWEVERNSRERGPNFTEADREVIAEVHRRLAPSALPGTSPTLRAGEESPGIFLPRQRGRCRAPRGGGGRTMTDRAAHQYRDILRRDFLAFSHRAFRELNGATPYLGNWHLDVMAAKLEAVRRGEIKRLAIALPPRHLKSHMASIAFAAFVLGHDPTRQIICASYSQDLAEKLSRDCRALMGAGFYRDVFDTEFAPDKQAVAEFATSERRFPPRHIGRRRADRARRGPHHHRRSPEGGGGLVGCAAQRRQ